MNWKSIIVTAIVTGLVTVITGTLIFYIQLREPKLVYSLEQTAPFQGDQETLSIQHVTITNEGKKQVSNVVAEVRVPGARIKERRVVAEPALSFSDKVSTEAYRIEAKGLNPGERIGISLLTSGTPATQLNPQVSLRGDGVTGRIATKQEAVKVTPTIITALVAAYAGVLAALLTRRRYRRALGHLLRTLAGGRGSGRWDEQNRNIGSLFALRGAIEEAEYYIARRTDCAYWAEADLIAAKAIDSNDSAKADLCKQVLIDLLDYVPIVESSQAVVHYNISRICRHLGQSDEAKQHLAKARTLDNELVSLRLTKDPLLDGADVM